MRHGSNPNFIIILNDNNMSISENVGGLSEYLERSSGQQKPIMRSEDWMWQIL